MHYGVAVLALLALLGCNPPKAPNRGASSGASRPAPVDGKTAPDADAKAKVTEDAKGEKVMPPNAINGALLTCAFATDPTVQGNEIVVGCGLHDAAGARVTLSAIADLTVFSYEAPPHAPDAVAVQALADTSNYDIAYFFKASSAERSRDLARETTVKVAFQGLKDGSPDRGLALKISSILEKAKAFIREARTAGAAVFAVVASKARDGKDKALETGSAALEKAKEAEAVFRKIFDR